MPAKKRTQLRNVTNVAASKTALITVPCGPRYHQIILQHAYSGGTNTIAAAATNILEIRVKVGTKVQRVISGTQLRDMNLLNGTGYDCTGLPNTAPGVSFPIFFAEPWRDDELDQDALAWYSNLWDSFTIEVDLSTGTSPTLVAVAVTDETIVRSPVAICKWYRPQWPAAGTSFDILLDRKDYLQQITIYPDGGASNTPSQVTLRLDNDVYHELSFTANTALLTQSRMTPAASGRTSGIYDLVADHDGLLASAYKLSDWKEALLTIAAASAMSGTTVAILEKLGLPD
jgi:hypothetical protein